MNISYNGKTPENFDCWLATRPVITPSEMEYDRYKVPGRNGELLSDYGTRSNAKISFTIHQKITSQTTHSIDEIRNWLSPIYQADYNMHNLLVLSDDNAYCYEIINSQINAYHDLADNYKRIEVELEVYPFKYRRVENIPSVIRPNQVVTLNLDTDQCEPTYHVLCETSSGTISINGKPITVYNSSPNEIMIDVRRKMAYTVSGHTKISADNKINGDYKDMVLKNGSNTLETSSGVSFGITITREGYIV